MPNITYSAVSTILIGLFHMPIFYSIEMDLPGIFHIVTSRRYLGAQRVALTEFFFFFFFAPSWQNRFTLFSLNGDQKISSIATDFYFIY